MIGTHPGRKLNRHAKLGGVGVIALAAAATSGEGRTQAVPAAPPPLEAQAAAQSSVDPTIGSTAPDDATDAGEEIIVTAQKRAERLQDVPISIAAFESERLTDQSVLSVADLPRIVPGLSFTRQAQASNVRINIRGVGAASGSAIESSSAFFLDDVYVPRPGALTGKFFDLSSLEVLRGPQGTLFGRNASVGAVSIRTQRPTQDFEGYAEGQIASYGTFEGRAALNLPVTGDLAVRIAGIATTYDGFARTTANDRRFGGQNSYGGRVSVLATPLKNLEWDVRADYLKIGGNGFPLHETVRSTVTPTGAANFIARLNGAVPDLYEPFDRRNNDFVSGNVNDRQFGVSSRLSYELGDGATIRLVNAYRDWRADQRDSDVVFTPILLISRESFFSSENQSHELQYLSPTDRWLDGRLQLVGGIYYFEEDYSIGERFDFSDDFCGIVVRNARASLVAPCLATNTSNDTDLTFEQTTKSIAGYAQGTFDITDQVSVTLGGRYTKDEKTGTFRQLVTNAAGPLVRGAELTALAFDDERFTYRVNLSWTPTSSTLLFANYSTGFKSGGFNSGGSAASLSGRRTFESELVKNYELGIKADWLKRRLITNLVLYRMDIDDFQDRAFDGVSFNIGNAGSLRQQGAELEITVRPVRGLSLDFALAYLDSKFTDYTNAPGLPGFGGTQDLTGKPNNYSPEFQGNYGLQYQAGLGGGYSFTGRGDLSFISDSNVGGVTDANPQSIQQGYGLVSASVKLTGPGERWSVAVFGQNLLDKGYCQYIFAQTLDNVFGVRDRVTGGTLQRCNVGMPRVVGARARVQF